MPEVVAAGYPYPPAWTRNAEVSGVGEAYRPGITTLEVWEVDDLHVEVFPDVAVLTGKGYVAGRWMSEPWSHHLRFCDLYVRKEGVWQLYLSQVTPMEARSEDSSRADLL